MKVLVVDDSLTMRKIVVHILQKFDNVHIVEAENGFEGLSSLALDCFDLVITDWNMPVMNGIEMVRRLRGNGLTVPVIMLTSGGSPWELIQAYRVGVDGFVTKPMTAHSLREKVKRVIAFSAHSFVSFSDEGRVAEVWTR